MLIVQLRQPGGVEVLEPTEVAMPEPGPGQVRVKAMAIGVGRPDVLIREGSYKWMPPLPAVPGNEVAGVVDAVGAGVTALKPGDRVFVSARELPQRGGGYAQALCVQAEAPFVLPEAISFDDACSLGNVQLAQALLLGCNGGAPARSIFVPGAAGGVATALAQLARHHGVQVIGTASTPEKAAVAREAGVQMLVDADPAHIPEAVMAATDGRGVDMAFDHLGGTMLIACLRALAPLGMVVSYNALLGAPQPEVFEELRRLMGRSPALRVFSIHSFDADRTQRRTMMQKSIELMAAGHVRAPRAAVLPLADARRAHELLESRSVVGKIVLRP